MGTLFGFAVGYVIGARAGSEGFEEVLEALRSVRESDEFQALVGVVKAHARGTAAVLGQRLATNGDGALAEAMLDRARSRAAQD